MKGWVGGGQVQDGCLCARRLTPPAEEWNKDVQRNADRYIELNGSTKKLSSSDFSNDMAV